MTSKTEYYIAHPDGNTVLSHSEDTRVFADEQARRVAVNKQLCADAIEAQAPDFKQAKALAVLAGITVSGYDTAKAQGILNLAQSLRDQFAVTENKLLTAQTLTDLDAIV